MEVHPPEHPIFTWKQFFIHMATVCLGLLIAIGLEQSVESIHRAHERRDLREALYVESEQIVTDSLSTRQLLDDLRLRINIRIAQLSALRDNRPAPPAPKFEHSRGGDRPNDPIWQAAKTSNSAALLSRDELTVYGEVSAICGTTSSDFDAAAVATRGANAYASRFGGNAFTADLAHASKPEMQEMIERLANLDEALHVTASYSSDAGGAAEAIHGGERDIAKIYAAEKSAKKRDDDAFATRLASFQTLPPSSPNQATQ
jgi:hypothetical protein